MTISDVVLVERAGFSIAEHMQGSDFEQVLRIAVLILPAMALATITRNVSSQVFTALGVLAVCALIGVVADGADVFMTIDWVYDSIAAIIIAGFATAVILWQYTRRQILGARVLLGSAVVLTWLVSRIPAAGAVGVGSLWDKKAVDPAAIRVTLDEPSAAPSPIRRETLRLPLRIAGVPKGLRMWADVRTLEVRPGEEPGFASADQRGVGEVVCGG